MLVCMGGKQFQLKTIFFLTGSFVNLLYIHHILAADGVLCQRHLVGTGHLSHLKICVSPALHICTGNIWETL